MSQLRSVLGFDIDVAKQNLHSWLKTNPTDARCPAVQRVLQEVSLHRDPDALAILSGPYWPASSELSEKADMAEAALSELQRGIGARLARLARVLAPGDRRLAAYLERLGSLDELASRMLAELDALPRAYSG